MEDRDRNVEALFAGRNARSLGSVMFNVAHAYARSADASWQSLVARNDADFAAPAIMCQSSAIELLLKFFVATDNPTCQSPEDFEAAGVNIRGHEYSVLFGRVSANGQKRIATAFARIRGADATPADFRAALVALGDDPFVHWRYVYEKRGYSTLDKRLLDCVTDALGKAAEAVRKSQMA